MARMIRFPAMLRNRVMALVTLLIFLPVLVVTLSGLIDQGTRYWISSEADGVLVEALTLDEAGLDQLAWRSGVRIRVFSTTGTLIHEVDYDHADRVGMTMSRMFLGRSGGPTLQQLDGEQTSVATAPWFRQALQGERSGCEETFSGEFLVCRSAKKDGNRVIEVAETSRMALRVFHGLKVQLLKLTLYSLPFAIVLGFILGRLFVRPAERLVKDVESRMGQVNPAPLAWTEQGEFGQIARAFDALQDELAGRREAYGQAMADLAHELKNPVAALQMAGENLSGDGELTEARRERLARAVGAASQRLDRVVGEFLELARAETLIPSEPQRLSVLEIARGVASQLHQQSTGCAIEVDGTDGWAIGDPNHLERVLHNLIENAVSFCPADGRVSVLVRTENSQVVCAVTDDGPGVPDAVRNHLFERFYTSRSEQGGTGLGLSIVQALLRSMDGQIHLGDAPDRGACFVFSVPAANISD